MENLDDLNNPSDTLSGRKKSNDIDPMAAVQYPSSGGAPLTQENSDLSNNYGSNRKMANSINESAVSSSKKRQKRKRRDHDKMET